MLRVTQILARRMKNNPILLGEPGVGKTAIAEGLARAVVQVTAMLVLSRLLCCSPDFSAEMSPWGKRGPGWKPARVAVCV